MLTALRKQTRNRDVKSTRTVTASTHVKIKLNWYQLLGHGRPRRQNPRGGKGNILNEKFGLQRLTNFKLLSQIKGN